MQMNDGFENSLMLSYSPTAKDAIGLRTDYMRNDDVLLNTLTYNRLLKRWNQPESQGNLFLLTGLGAAEGNGNIDPAATLGIEADWETRRIYFSYENRLIGSSAIDDSFSQKFRTGFAPYVADYDAVHTWLMVQIDHRPSHDDEITVTPFIRLFNTEVLGELGISSKKDVMFNVTFQF